MNKIRTWSPAPFEVFYGPPENPTLRLGGYRTHEAALEAIREAKARARGLAPLIGEGPPVAFEVWESQGWERV